MVSHSATTTGAPYILLWLSEWLKDIAGFEVHIACRAGGGMVAAYKSIGRFYSPCDCDPSRSLMTRLCRKIAGRNIVLNSSLREKIDCEKYDLIYSNTIMNGVFVQDMRPAAPVITHVHEMDYWIERAGPENVSAVKSQSVTIIAASEAVRECLVNRYAMPLEKVVTLYEFVPENALVVDARSSARIRAAFGIMAGDYVVCASGWEFWRKGRDLIPQLLSDLNHLTAGRKVHLIWVGAASTAEDKIKLNFDLKKLGLLSLYHETGIVSNAKDYFSAGDVFALLSRDDPFPLVCLENAALGKPLVCFAAAGGMPELVRKGAGIVVPYLDVRAMADAIIKLLNDVALRSALGAVGRSAVQDGFTTNVAGPRFLSVIMDALRRRPPEL